MYQVHVTEELLNEAEQKWACPDDPVFQLTPPDFNAQASVFYEEIGHPPVTSDTFWTVYLRLLRKFEVAAVSDAVKERWKAADDAAFEANITLIQGAPLRDSQVLRRADEEELFNSESDAELTEASFSDSSILIYASFSDQDEAEVASMIIPQKVTISDIHIRIWQKY